MNNPTQEQLDKFIEDNGESKGENLFLDHHVGNSLCGMLTIIHSLKDDRIYANKELRILLSEILETNIDRITEARSIVKNRNNSEMQDGELPEHIHQEI